MLLEVGSIYKTLENDYAVCDELINFAGFLDKNKIFLVLEYIGIHEWLDTRSPEWYYHYKIFIDDRIRYILVVTNHKEIDKFFQKL